jgi:endonuclease III
LGREICHARKPDCTICPLQDLCDFFKSNQAEMID